MYDFLRGKLLTITESTCILDVQGVGYKLHTPSSYQNKQELILQEVLFYVSLQIRENSHSLYGFLYSMQRELFETLITISGVGPKTALILIGMFSIEEITQAILSNDIVLISKAPGIGKKTAERLIMELKDKLPQFLKKHSHHYTPSDLVELGAQKILDAVSALIHLGYQKPKAEKAIQTALKETSEDVSLEQLITIALRHCVS